MNLNRSHPYSPGTVTKEEPQMHQATARGDEKVKAGWGGNCRRGPLRKRVTLDEERMKKNRKTIDHHLKRMGSTVGKNLSLNAEGVCYFPYQKFIIVVEIPEDNPDVCFIYTMVCRLAESDNVMGVIKLAMELNYMQFGTRGATLGLEGEEVNLCFSTPISALSSYCDLSKVLEDFMQTAVEMNRMLDTVRSISISARGERI